MSEIKPKTLFDHIKQITGVQDPKYWDKLSDQDKKTWSNYMVHRFLSMEPEWIDTIAELQPYTEILEPRELYLAYIGILPKSRKFLKYVKGKKTDKHEKWLVELVKQDYQCSIKEAEDYLDILYATKKGKEHIKYICQKYGVEPKSITKLKLKV